MAGRHMVDINGHQAVNPDDTVPATKHCVASQVLRLGVDNPALGEAGSALSVGNFWSFELGALEAGWEAGS